MFQIDPEYLSETKISSNETKEYLSKFESLILQSFDQLFIDRLNATHNLNDSLSLHAEEILHHERYLNRILKDFFQRDEYTQKLRDYLSERDNVNPFIIDGDQGSGKTCLMANLANSVSIDKLLHLLFMVEFNISG